MDIEMLVRRLGRRGRASRWMAMGAAAAALAGGAVATALSAGAAGAASQASSMSAGQTLTSGQTLVSGEGQYTLEMSPGGDLIEYQTTDPGTVIWSTSTAGSGHYATVQPNGELAVDDANGNVLWTDGTPTSGCAVLNVLGDGNVEVDNAAGAVWDSGTVTHMLDGDSIFSGEDVYAPNHAFALEMQPDGNLVYYNSDGQAIWSTGTGEHPGAYATIENGNFYILSASGSELWERNGSPNDQLDPQADGNVVLYNSASGVLWDSATKATSTGAITVNPAAQLGSAAPCPSSTTTTSTSTTGPGTSTSPGGSPTGTSTSTTTTIAPTTPTETTVTVTPPKGTGRTRQLRVKLAFDWTYRYSDSYLKHITFGALPPRLHWTAKITTAATATTRRRTAVDTASTAGQRHALLLWLEDRAYTAGETVQVVLTRSGYRSQSVTFHTRLYRIPSYVTVPATK